MQQCLERPSRPLFSWKPLPSHACPQLHGWPGMQGTAGSWEARQAFAQPSLGDGWSAFLSPGLAVGADACQSVPQCPLHDNLPSALELPEWPCPLLSCTGAGEWGGGQMTVPSVQWHLPPCAVCLGVLSGPGHFLSPPGHSTWLWDSPLGFPEQMWVFSPREATVSPL